MDNKNQTMSESFLLSDFKIKRICPYCQSYKVELIKKCNTGESFISMLTVNGTDQWGVIKQKELILKCDKCQRVFKFSDSFAFTPFGDDDLKDEKNYLFDYLNDLSLNNILSVLNQIIVLLNTDPLNVELWDKLELVFFKLKNDNIKMKIEKQERKTDIVFFSYYQTLTKIKKEKAKSISEQDYENASKIKEIENQYIKWKSDLHSIAFINKNHFYKTNGKSITYHICKNSFLNQKLIRMILKTMDKFEIEDLLFKHYLR